MKNYDPTAAMEMFPGDGWVKAAASSANGTGCVELCASLDGQYVGMRDSKNPNAGVLVFTHGEIEAFIDGANKGEFDKFVR